MNKIYIYKINGENVAVVATCNYVARQGLDQKFGPEVSKQYQFECSEIVQVQGTFQIDASPDDVKVVNEEVVEEIQQKQEEQKND